MTAIWDQFVGFLRSILTGIADSLTFLGGHRWAAAIVLLTLGIRTLVLPLAIKQIKSMRQIQALQPEIQRLRQKYRNDRQRQMQEMQELYSREGVNPAASCLPLLPQMPVLFAMFYVVRDLDPAGGMPFLMLGDLGQKSSGSIAGWLLILIMTAASLIAARQLNTGATDQQRRLQMLMPLMFTIFFINLPAALVLYYTTQQLYQLVQQIVMTRDMRKPGSGWKGILGIGDSRLQAPRPPKPKKAKEQVKATSGQPDSPKGGSPGTPRDAQRDTAVEVLAARRSLDEKRERRRRRKKKRKR